MNLFIRLLRIRIKIIRLQDFANFDLDHTGTETQKRGKILSRIGIIYFRLTTLMIPFLNVQL